MDVMHINKSCSDCKKMEETKKKKEISTKDFLGWYIKHEPQCFLNHEGTSAVSIFFTHIIFLDESQLGIHHLHAHNFPVLKCFFFSLHIFLEAI